MKRALMYASVASMIQQFNMDNIRLLQKQGYQVDVACNMENGGSITQERVALLRQELEGMGVRVFHIPITRKITDISDMIASIRETKTLIKENQYALIHCHSPIGGVVCRLANRLSRGYQDRKLIYTAHGFHFYKGAQKKGWLIFYPVEKICSFFTDVLITINQEDFALAKRRMNAKAIEYVPGVGIDEKRFAEPVADHTSKNQKLGLPESAFMLFAIGELNENKNHEVLIRALKLLPKDIHLVIAGKGDLGDYLVEIAENCGVSNRLHLLGYRTDIADLLRMADLFVFSSFREGLPVSVMEAMAAGKPVVCSKIRGNTDLIEDNKGGFLLKPTDINGFAEAIASLYYDHDMMAEMGKNNLKKIQQFTSNNVNARMDEIYRNVMK